MRYEAENTTEQLHADVSQLEARAIEAERKCVELAAALNAIKEYLYEHEDISDDINGSVRPNWAMNMLREFADKFGASSTILLQHDAEVERQVLERVQKRIDTSEGDMDFLQFQIKHEFAPKGESDGNS